MIFVAEYTDTFSGESNYSWVRRAYFDAPGQSDTRELMRMARKALDLVGLRGRVYNTGDTIEFRPYGMCTMLFVSPANQ